MQINLCSSLRPLCEELYGHQSEEILSYLPSFPVSPAHIKAVLVNEVVADSPENDFYREAENPYYMQTTLPLFQKAGAHVHTIQDIMGMGIYITSAVKLPKTGTAVTGETIQRFVPLLQEELSLFSDLKAIMLMGDVAKKAMNRITKQESGKNAIPAVSTYKLRHSEILYNGVRLMPAYIMTGQNLLIEKSKLHMSAEEIAKMLELISPTK